MSMGNGKGGATTTIGSRVDVAKKKAFKAAMEAIGHNESSGVSHLVDWAIAHGRLPGDDDAPQEPTPTPPPEKPKVPFSQIEDSLRRELAAAIVLIVRMTLGKKPVDAETAINAVKEAFLTGRLQQEVSKR